MRTRASAFLILTATLSVLPIPAAAQGWRHFTSKDEMSGKIQAFAVSPHTPPTTPMSFPYGGVVGWLGFGCDGQSEWAYVGFSQQPNLTDTDTKDGYNALDPRMKWDSSIQIEHMTQDWGERFLHFNSARAAIQRMLQSSTALLELHWYGSGTVYFRFSLAGSADAIGAARKACH